MWGFKQTHNRRRTSKYNANQRHFKAEAGNDAGQLPMWNVTPTPPVDDGITVSMLNGKSRPENLRLTFCTLRL